MRRIAAVIGTIASFCLLASAAPKPKPPLELTCVTVTDADGRYLGISHEIAPYHPADERELKGAVLNHLNLILLQSGRPLAGAADVELVDNPIPPLDKPRRPRKPPTTLLSPLLSTEQAPSDGCDWICYCASPIYCVESTLRNNPKDKPRAGICGCATPCGSCRVCRSVCH